MGEVAVKSYLARRPGHPATAKAQVVIVRAGPATFPVAAMRAPKEGAPSGAWIVMQAKTADAAQGVDAMRTLAGNPEIERFVCRRTDVRRALRQWCREFGIEPERRRRRRH